MSRYLVARVDVHGYVSPTCGATWATRAEAEAQRDRDAQRWPRSFGAALVNGDIAVMTVAECDAMNAAAVRRNSR